jgi:hypothetical protein
MTICLGKVLLKDPHELLLDEYTTTKTWNLDNGWKISYTIKIFQGFTYHDHESIDQICTKIFDKIGGIV